MRLTQNQLLDLQMIWHKKWMDKKLPEGGVTELWFDSVMELLTHLGVEIIPNYVREAEYIIMQRELGPEYFSALSEAVRPPAHLSESAAAVYLITASPEERLAALQKILGPGRP